MKKPIYIQGSALEPIRNSNELAIIAHSCNNLGKFGKGFVLALNQFSPLPKQKYLQWYQNNSYEGTPFKLGCTQMVWVNTNTIIANMIAQNGLYNKYNNPTPFDYNAFETCLIRIKTYMDNFEREAQYSIHVPYLIGCGLGRGDWNKTTRILDNIICKNDINLYIYKYLQT